MELKGSAGNSGVVVRGDRLVCGRVTGEAPHEVCDEEKKSLSHGASRATGVKRGEGS